MVEESLSEPRYEVLEITQARAASPFLLHTMLEGVRTMSEVTALGLMWGYLRRRTQVLKEDAHPVLVMPGFMGGDASTMVLRRFLADMGFSVQPWLLGTNDGTQRLQSELLKRFLRLRQNYKRPIALVGHSLGGVFARELARQFPEDVSQVVTLGSPFSMADSKSVNRLVRRLFERVSGESIEERRTSMLRSDPSVPVGVPCTSIYSRSDGVVHWRSCLEYETAMTQNLEVWGSHCGLIVNSAVLHAVADRLAQPTGEWARFDFTKSGRSMLYPTDKAIYA